jgi:hypothetical protein
VATADIKSDGGLGCAVDPGVEYAFDCAVDPGLEYAFDCAVDPGVEYALYCVVDPGVETTVDCGAESEVDVRVDKVEPPGFVNQSGRLVSNCGVGSTPGWSWPKLYTSELPSTKN